MIAATARMAETDGDFGQRARPYPSNTGLRSPAAKRRRTAG
jgi:hypothetical protein